MPVAFEKVKSVRVEEAVARKPLRNARVVEVACSLVESLVNGKAKLIEKVGQEARQSLERHKVPVAKVVEVAFVVVELLAVNDCKVVEALRKVWAPLQELAVVVPKPSEMTFELKRTGYKAETGA